MKVINKNIIFQGSTKDPQISRLMTPQEYMGNKKQLLLKQNLADQMSYKKPGTASNPSRK